MNDDCRFKNGGRHSLDPWCETHGRSASWCAAALRAEVQGATEHALEVQVRADEAYADAKRTTEAALDMLEEAQGELEISEKALALVQSYAERLQGALRQLAFDHRGWLNATALQMHVQQVALSALSGPPPCAWPFVPCACGHVPHDDRCAEWTKKFAPRSLPPGAKENG